MTPSSARTRLLDVATELFYSNGIAATGVDKIVANSGISKPTLYAHFHSKDELVAAVLECRHSQQAYTLQAWILARAESPYEQLLAVFDWLTHWYTTDGIRGCVFINAIAEITSANHPAREIARSHKHWMRDYLAEIATKAGACDPEHLASDLMLLVDGANAKMLIEGEPSVATEARRLAAIVIETYKGNSSR